MRHLSANTFTADDGNLASNSKNASRDGKNPAIIVNPRANRLNFHAYASETNSQCHLGEYDQIDFFDKIVSIRVLLENVMEL